MSDRWAEVWSRRSVELPVDDDVLPALMAADGLDTAFGAVSPSAWSEFACSVAGRLKLSAGSSIFEVGCGAGAFLYPLQSLGLEIGGIDRSAKLVEEARRFLPGGQFSVGEAAAVEPQPSFDAVVSCGVFLYFPDLGYAERVIGVMGAKARRAVAILDIPDLASRKEALDARIAALGGESAYTERYSGLDHLYYDREWVRDRLAEQGLEDIRIGDQEVAGYANGNFRFNAWGFVKR